MRRFSFLLVAALIATATHARADGERRVVVRRHTAGPWVVFGLGFPVIVAGLFTELFSQPMGGDSCASCGPQQPNDASRAGQIAGWIGVGTGLSMIAFGLTWHFTERTGPVVTVAPTVGGLSLRATF
jgi:hypothetical protein